MRAEDLHLPDPTEVPAEIIAPVITRLATLQSALAARLIGMSVHTHQQDSAPQMEDELLTVADAARLLNVGEDWLDLPARRPVAAHTAVVEKVLAIQQGRSAEMACSQNRLNRIHRAVHGTDHSLGLPSRWEENQGLQGRVGQSHDTG